MLITGESGTGKEVVARAIHARAAARAGRSSRSTAPRCRRRCSRASSSGTPGARSPTRKTSRTGLSFRRERRHAVPRRDRRHAARLQPKLLRALQERTVRPVGGENEVPFDVRWSPRPTATSSRHRGRSSFARTSTTASTSSTSTLPPLRARGGDVLLLAQHFLDGSPRGRARRSSGFSAAAAEKLIAYAWPGNVRELENCIERAVALARFEEISVDDLPEQVRELPRRTSRRERRSDRAGAARRVERRYVAAGARGRRRQQALAARVLGFDRKTLYRKLLRWGVGDE